MVSLSEGHGLLLVALLLTLVSGCTGNGCVGAQQGVSEERVRGEGLRDDVDGTTDADREGRETRAETIARVLREDNREHAARSPELVEGQYRKMASTPFFFLRGTSALFLEDSRTLGRPAYYPSAFATEDGDKLLFTGDAHPENFGTYRNADGELLFDFNDFDTATRGPWQLELRRLAIGWYVAGRMLEERAGAERRLRRELPARAIDGYIDEIEAQRAGEGPIQVRDDDDAGVIVADLFRRAVRDGDIREELDDFTRVEDGERRMFIGTVKESGIEGVYRSEMAPIDEGERARIEAIIAAWRHTIVDSDTYGDAFFEVRDAARRLGAGVGSYAIERYYVLLRGASEDVDDDVLLDVKEGVPAAHVADRPAERSPSWSSEGERVVRIARDFQEFAHNDPMLGWADVDGRSYHVQDRTKYQKRLDVERFVERRGRQSGRRFSDDDLRDAAYLTGRVLARGHAGSRTPSGRDGLDVLSEAIGDRADDLRVETMQVVQAAGPRTFADHGLFRRLLEEQGPLLE